MIITQKDIRTLFDKFSTARVLVIGDVMVDTYLTGKVERISPEAPVPVVALKKRDNMLGGAANVALNIRSLGAEVFLCSVIGNDNQGDVLLNLMKSSGLSPEGMIGSNDRITTTKYRIMSSHMQMLRVDEEMDTDLDENESNKLISCIERLITNKKPDVIILQDYNKGVLTLNTIGKISHLASQAGIPVAVDPKKKNFTAYSGITLFKPNLKEITEGLKIEVDPLSVESLQKAALIIHTGQNVPLVMITLSEHGVFISSKNGDDYVARVIPAVLRSIADVSGAGDTVISIVALCMAAKADPIFTAALSNLAGGIVCEQSGVVPVNRLRLFEEAISELPVLLD